MEKTELLGDYSDFMEDGDLFTIGDDKTIYIAMSVNNYHSEFSRYARKRLMQKASPIRPYYRQNERY